jgi:hypothetical protein
MLQRNIIAFWGVNTGVESCPLAAGYLLPCPQAALCLFIAIE